MSPTKLFRLTPLQESLIPVYQETWKRYALSPAPFQRQKASLAVNAAYTAIGLSEPKLLIFDSPYAAFSAAIFNHLGSQLGRQLESQLVNQLGSQLVNQVNMQLDNPLRQQLESQLGKQLENQIEKRLEKPLRLQLENQLQSYLESQIESQLRSLFGNCVESELWAARGSCLDFCINVLNCDHDERKWKAFQLLVKHCGWIFPFENTCVVCAPPIKLCFDGEQRLHALGKPAIEFADGFSVWVYHGVRLPEKYGKLHPTQWQAQWLLEEDNQEVRQVLVQNISYTRIPQDLQATKLDIEQESTSVISLESPQKPKSAIVSEKFAIVTCGLAVAVLTIPLLVVIHALAGIVWGTITVFQLLQGKVLFQAPIFR
jgi:hypothetical protein